MRAAFAFAACTLLLASLEVAQAQPQVEPPSGGHFYSGIFRPYEASHLPEVSFENSARLRTLLRAGNLYLSLPDAIALALENNLDIVLQRYQPAIAGSDLLRARGGASSLRGVPLVVYEPPPGVGGPQSPLLNLPASGSTPTTTVPTGLLELTAIAPPSPANLDITQSTFSSGSPIPMFDPALTGTLQYQKSTTPEVNTLVTGSSALTSRGLTGNLGLDKGFSLGTQFAATFNAASQNTNSIRNIYNPYSTSSLGINIVQPLLRGFGIGVNRRFIRIARNNQKVSDLVFQEQAIETVFGIVAIYYDLVSFMEDVRVKRETLALAQRLYEDNKQKVDQGTLAPIELVRAQADIAAARQDLANSEGYELQQELIIKTLLSKRGTAEPELRDARVIATTPLELPADEPRPIPDLVAHAYDSRPELQAARLQLSNSHITLEGSRNELLPQVDIVGTVQNSGLAGQPNPTAATSAGVGTPSAGTTGTGTTGATGTGVTGTTATGVNTPTAVGGVGSSLGQIFRNNYPTYAIGVQLNLPLRNRIAEGDYARDAILVRQSQIRFQQLENQVRLQVEGANIALQRARAAYDAAVDARKLQEESLRIEMERYDNGLSTNFLVMQYQSYVAQARSTEVAARGVVAKARNALERAVGETLANHNIQIQEVYRGQLSTPPSPLPEAPAR